MVFWAICIGVAVIGTPVYLAVEAVRLLRGRRRPRRPPTRERARVQDELKEQYARGMLTLAGLEERVDIALRTESQLELASVLDDLPPARPRVSLVALFDALGGIVVLLAVHAAVGRLAGAALAVGAVFPALRWRVVAYAFLAGVALLAAPVAAVPLAASAVWRWREG
jgi:Domain of unknown function (DUF1707)